MTKITLNIQGMTCSHCVMRVQKALSEVPGVQRATVTLDPGHARVEFDETAATTDLLSAAVARAGYTVTATG